MTHEEKDDVHRRLFWLVVHSRQPINQEQLYIERSARLREMQQVLVLQFML